MDLWHLATYALGPVCVLLMGTTLVCWKMFQDEQKRVRDLAQRVSTHADPAEEFEVRLEYFWGEVQHLAGVMRGPHRAGGRQIRDSR
jgi:hypothetical protein